MLGNGTKVERKAQRASGDLRRASTDAGWRSGTVIALDLLSWKAALVVSSAFYAASASSSTALTLLGIALVAQLLIGAATGLYRGHFRQFSFEEAGAVAVTAGATGVLVIAAEFSLADAGRGGQIIVVSTSLAVCLMFGHRYLRRVRARRIAELAASDRTAVIVYGAGEGGERAIRSMQNVGSSEYRPVAIVDDHPSARNLRIGGVRVEGGGVDLPAIARRHEARHVLLAMPSASGEELSKLHERVAAAGLETLVMPPMQRLVGDGSPREISRYSDEDVLHRKVVDIDSSAIAELVSGARVLVTGAGGSIGSELIRQLSAFEPASLIALDRDDSLLHSVVASLRPEQRGTCVSVLADIRDVDRLDEVFAHHRPQLVFHTAALKHVPALEGAPSEGWKTNVLGTANVLSVCEHRGVDRVVNISTDKAANPANVLGYSKRIAERLTASSARRTGRPFVSVRFGNVIGSRGSALETFTEQINQGGPVTVTHPDVTRYFMAVREAVRLTMQAAAIGRPAEVLVLDMGTPMSVLDVAQQLIDQSGQEIEIVFTGLRPGEKMHEILLGNGEAANRPFHPMIDHVVVDPLDLSAGLDHCAAHGVAPNTLAGLALMTDCSPHIDPGTVVGGARPDHSPTSPRRTP